MFIIQEFPSLFKPNHEILALGADTRQRMSWTDRGRIFSLWPQKDFLVPQDFFDTASAFISKKFRLKPRALCFDPHPLFASKTFAPVVKARYFPKASLRPVFHHVAHVAHFSFSHGLRKNFIGIAFDGTGYGPDGLVWGGEFFVYRAGSFERAAYLKNLSLPGNEKAIWEPWRIALGVLYKIYKKNVFKMKFDFLKNFSKDEQLVACQMIDKDFNTPLSSSAGRLFDAVSAFLNVKTVISKEAEAAVALEKTACDFKGKALAYRFGVNRLRGAFVIDHAPVFKEITKDLRAKKNISEIAFRYHKGLAYAVARTCLMLKKKTGIEDVFLSGGVFMNDLLCQEVAFIFKKQGLNLFFASKPVMMTDSGISLGQIAACLMEKTCA